MPGQYTNSWRRTIASLDGAHVRHLADAAVRTAWPSPLPPGEYKNPRPVINILERLGSCTVAISWRDSCTGHYGYQTWRVSKARQAGECAVSGAPIRRGEVIYRPDFRPSRPANGDAMICTAVVDEALRT